jgi:hypothetical protein
MPILKAGVLYFGLVFGPLVVLKSFVIGALDTFAVSSRGSQEALCGGSCLCSFFPQRASRKRIALQLF